MARLGVLNYVTPKYVALSDRRLGLIYYILLLLILVFTVLELFLWKGYLEVSSFAVSVSFFDNTDDQRYSIRSMGYLW